jgi:hypothetical protein
MATRSRIGIELTDENGERIVKSIYCHWDGYPTGVGQTLIDHYQDRDKVLDLIELGAISYLEKEVDQYAPTGSTHPHSFDHPHPGVTVAYHRDRKEEKVPARVDAGVADFFRKDFEQYGYILTEEGEWLVAGVEKEPIPLHYVLSGVDQV